MRIAVLGGGPGGLYFASLWKARHPHDGVELFEQNPADATWGFGVVFSERALEFLREDDQGTVDLISPHMEAWRDITLVHRGERIVVDGIGFSAIGRLELLQLLQGRARAAGVVCSFERPIRAIDELAGFDLVVAADGVHSLVRRSFEADFGFSLSYLTKQIHLVRHGAILRHADTDLCRDRRGRVQCPPLSLCAHDEQVSRGM
jgi:2-polyprenyl-6-methoxyphenol hydroxylase-like FAD-dependent oxidoreductase